MSLIHWWPLKGGQLIDYIGGVSLEGSLGSTAYGRLFGTGWCSKTQIKTENSQLKNAHSFSIAFWVKLAGTTSGTWADVFGLNLTNGTVTKPLRLEVTSADNTVLKLFNNDLLTGSGGAGYSIPIEKLVWTHFVIAKDDTTITTYKNGSRIGSYNFVNAGYSNAWGTGEFHLGDAGDSSAFYGAFNDVRVYDHALSLAEAKELSKGLMVHYTFDDDQMEETTNLLPFPTPTGLVENDSTVKWNKSLHPNALTISGWTHGYNSGVGESEQGYHAMWQEIEGIPTIVYNNLNDTVYKIDTSTGAVTNSQLGRKNRWLGVYGNIAAGACAPMVTTIGGTLTGQSVTISYEAKATPSGADAMQVGVGLYHYITSSTSMNFYSTGNKAQYQDVTSSDWKKYSITFTANAALDTSKAARVYVYGYGKGEGIAYVRNVQIEIKDHPTGYTNGTRPSRLFNEAGLITPDSVSKVIGVTNAMQGTGACYFNGSNYITHPMIINAEEKGATASFWIKSPLGISGASWVAFADACSQLGFGPYTPSEGVTYGVIASVNGTNKRRMTNLVDLWQHNQWNHVVVTYKPNSATGNRCFINGVETTYGDADYWSHSSYLTLGARYSSGYSRNFSGWIDDFRLYYSVLSDQEILDLYKNSAYFTKTGDIVSTSFVEGAAAKVTKKHAIEAAELKEDFVVGAGYERLDYIEFSEAEYIDTGLAFSNANVPIIIEADIVKTKLSSNDCLAGCGNTAWTGPVMLNCHNGACEFGVNGYATASDGSGSIAANERLLIRAELYTKKENHNWYKNGNKINLGTNAYKDRTSSTSTLYIGAFHVGTGTTIASGSCWIGRLYSFKVWYGGFYRFLVPARRTADGVLGLYDMAGTGFYTNIGGGALKAGQNISKTEAKIYKNSNILGRQIIEI